MFVLDGGFLGSIFSDDLVDGLTDGIGEIFDLF